MGMFIICFTDFSSEMSHWKSLINDLRRYTNKICIEWVVTCTCINLENRKGIFSEPFTYSICLIVGLVALLI